MSKNRIKRVTLTVTVTHYNVFSNVHLKLVQGNTTGAIFADRWPRTTDAKRLVSSLHLVVRYTYAGDASRIVVRLIRHIAYSFVVTKIMWIRKSDEWSRKHGICNCKLLSVTSIKIYGENQIINYKYLRKHSFHIFRYLASRRPDLRNFVEVPNIFYTG